MTQYQLQKKQVKAILGVHQIDPSLTLSELAQEVFLAIYFNHLEKEYPDVLFAASSVIQYFSAGSSINEPVGGKAFSLFAKIIKEKLDLNSFLS